MSALSSLTVATVTEFDVRAMAVRVDGDVWYVVLRADDGTDVEVNGEVFADRFASQIAGMRPDRCDYVTDRGEMGCPNLADPARGDDRCDVHATGRRWP